MPPSKRLRCDDPEWTRRKAAIEEMYVFDRLSQVRIRQKLADDGFSVTWAYSFVYFVRNT